MSTALSARVAPPSTLSEVVGRGASAASVAITGTVKVDAIVTSLVKNNDAVSGFLLQEELHVVQRTSDPARRGPTQRTLRGERIFRTRSTLSPHT